GYLTLYPSGAPLPLASNLNFTVGQTIPNLLTVKVGGDGKVNIFNKWGQTHVVVDVAGWYDSTPGGSLSALGGPSVAATGSHGGGPDAVSVDTPTPTPTPTPGAGYGYFHP